MVMPNGSVGICLLQANRVFNDVVEEFREMIAPTPMPLIRQPHALLKVIGYQLSTTHLSACGISRVALVGWH